MLKELFQIPQRYRFSSKSQHLYHSLKDPLTLFQIPQRYRFSSKSQRSRSDRSFLSVVLDTTKVQIFKQITTKPRVSGRWQWLFQIPQRYRFSSKSQLFANIVPMEPCCFRYHKGTDFQANHNCERDLLVCPTVVLDTTKVQIFKQITTGIKGERKHLQLFQIPQRYRFSSKSQLISCEAETSPGCFRYHKGTDFQANHNPSSCILQRIGVVLDTTKVQIFKQITTQIIKLNLR